MKPLHETPVFTELRVGSAMLSLLAGKLFLYDVTYIDSDQFVQASHLVSLKLSLPPGLECSPSWATATRTRTILTQYTSDNRIFQVVSLALWVRYSDKGQPDTNRVQLFAKGLRIISWNASNAYDRLQAALLEASKAKAQASESTSTSTAPFSPGGLGSTSQQSHGSEGTPVTETAAASAPQGLTADPSAHGKQEWHTSAGVQDAEMPWIFALSSIVSLKVTTATFVAAGKHLPTMFYATWQRSYSSTSATTIRHGSSTSGSVNIRYQTRTQLSGVQADFVRNPGYNANVYRTTNAERASYLSRAATTLRQMVKDATMSTNNAPLHSHLEGGGSSGAGGSRLPSSQTSRRPDRQQPTEGGTLGSSWMSQRGSVNETTAPIARSRPWAMSTGGSPNQGAQGGRLRRGTSADAADTTAVPGSMAPSSPLAQGGTGRLAAGRLSVRPRSESHGSLPLSSAATGAAAWGVLSAERATSTSPESPHNGSHSFENRDSDGSEHNAAESPTENETTPRDTAAAENTEQEAGDSTVDSVHLLDVDSLQGFITSAEASLVRLNQPSMLDLPLVEVNLTSDSGATFGAVLPTGEEQAARGPQWLLSIRVMGMAGDSRAKGVKGGSNSLDPSTVRGGGGGAGLRNSVQHESSSKSVSNSEWQRAPRVFYGPWHDRQRKALQAYFAPSSCEDELPWAAVTGTPQLPLMSRVRVSVVGPLLLTIPHITKGSHGTGPSHVAATSADAGRRATQATSGSTDAKEREDSGSPAWIHPETGTVQPEVFVKHMLRAVSAANAPWPDRAGVDGGTSASKGAQYRMHPDHLSELTGEETADLASLLGRWRSLESLCTACGPEAEAAARQKSLSRITLRVAPIGRRSLVSNAPSGSEGELSLFAEVVTDAVAWRGQQMLSVTRVSAGAVAAICQGTDVPVIQADSLDVTTRYTYPLSWKGVQQNRLEVTLGGSTLCPTSHHIDSITALLGDFSSPIDLPWVPPSLIPYSTLAKSHGAGEALFVPYVGSTHITFTDLVWMMHANGHNAIDVPGDIDANTFVSFGLPILTLALRSEDLTFNPASYSTQFKILGGCVDDAAARKQQQYRVITDVNSATNIIEARGRRGEPRPMPQVTSSTGARSMGAGWAGFSRSVRGGIEQTASAQSASTSSHSQQDGGTRPIPVHSVEIPALSAHFPAFHPAARGRGSTGFAVDVATFPLLQISGKYTYMTGTEGEDALGLDIAFPRPVVHATPHGIAAVLAAVKAHIGLGRQPCTTQQLEADGGSNVHSQRQEAWGFTATPKSMASSSAKESLQELIVSLCALNGPPAHRVQSQASDTRVQHGRSRSAIREVAAFCSRGSGVGISSFPREWWNTYQPGTSNAVSSGEAADMPTPVKLPCGGYLHATPVPRVDMSTVVTVRLPNATVLVPLQPNGAITPLEPMTHTQWYHTAATPRSRGSKLAASTRSGSGRQTPKASTRAVHTTALQTPLPRHAVVRISDTRITIVSDYACSSVNIFAGTLAAQLPLTTPSSPQQPPPQAPAGQTHHSLRRGSVAWSRVQRVSPRRGASPNAAPGLSSASGRPSLNPLDGGHTPPGMGSSAPTPVVRGWCDVLHISDITFDLGFQFSAPMEGMLGPLVTHRDDMRVGVHDVALGASIEQSVSLTQCALSWVSSFFQCSDPALTNPAAAPIIGTVRVGTSGRAHLSDSLTSACASALSARLASGHALCSTQAAAALLAMHLHSLSTENSIQQGSVASPIDSPGGSFGRLSSSTASGGDAVLRKELINLHTSQLLQRDGQATSSGNASPSADAAGSTSVLPAAITHALRALFGAEQDQAQAEVQRVLQQVRRGNTRPEQEIVRTVDRFIGDMHIAGLFVVYEHAGQTMRSSVLPLHAGTLRRMPTQGLRFSNAGADQHQSTLEEAANLHCGSVFQLDNDGDAVFPVRFPWAPITVSVFALRQLQWVAARRRGVSGEQGGAYDIDLAYNLHATLLGSRTERIQVAVGGLTGSNTHGGASLGHGGASAGTGYEHGTIAEEGSMDASGEYSGNLHSGASPAATLTRLRARTAGDMSATTSNAPGIRSPLGGGRRNAQSQGGSTHGASSGMALHARRAVLEAQFEPDSTAPPLSTAGGLRAAFAGHIEAGDTSAVYNCLHSYTFGANAPERAVRSRASKLTPAVSSCGARFGGTVTAGTTAGSVLAESTWMLHPGGSASCDTAKAAARVPVFVAFTPQVPSGNPAAPARAAAMAPSTDIRGAAAAAAGGAMAPMVAERGAMAVATAAAEETYSHGDAAKAHMSARSRVHIGDTGAVHPLAHTAGNLRARSYGGGRGTGARLPRTEPGQGGGNAFEGVKHSEEWTISAVMPHSRQCVAMLAALWGYAAYEVAPTATAIKVSDVRLNIIDADTQSVLRLTVPESVEIASSSEATEEYVSRWQLHADVKASFLKAVTGASARVHASSMQLVADPANLNYAAWQDLDSAQRARNAALNDEDQVLCSLLLSEVASMRLPLHFITDSEVSSSGATCLSIVALQRRLAEIAAGSNLALASWSVPANASCAARKPLDWESTGQGVNVAADMARLVWGVAARVGRPSGHTRNTSGSLSGIDVFSSVSRKFRRAVAPLRVAEAADSWRDAGVLEGTALGSALNQSGVSAHADSSPGRQSLAAQPDAASSGMHERAATDDSAASFGRTHSYTSGRESPDPVGEPTEVDYAGHRQSRTYVSPADALSPAVDAPYVQANSVAPRVSIARQNRASTRYSSSQSSGSGDSFTSADSSYGSGSDSSFADGHDSDSVMSAGDWAVLQAAMGMTSAAHTGGTLLNMAAAAKQVKQDQHQAMGKSALHPGEKPLPVHHGASPPDDGDAKPGLGWQAVGDSAARYTVGAFGHVRGVPASPFPIYAIVHHVSGREQQGAGAAGALGHTGGRPPRAQAFQRGTFDVFSAGLVSLSDVISSPCSFSTFRVLAANDSGCSAPQGPTSDPTAGIVPTPAEQHGGDMEHGVRSSPSTADRAWEKLLLRSKLHSHSKRAKPDGQKLQRGVHNYALLGPDTALHVNIPAFAALLPSWSLHGVACWSADSAQSISWLTDYFMGAHPQPGVADKLAMQSTGTWTIAAPEVRASLQWALFGPAHLYESVCLPPSDVDGTPRKAPLWCEASATVSDVMISTDSVLNDADGTWKNAHTAIVPKAAVSLTARGGATTPWRWDAAKQAVYCPHAAAAVAAPAVGLPAAAAAAGANGLHIRRASSFHIGSSAYLYSDASGEGGLDSYIDMASHRAPEMYMGRAMLPGQPYHSQDSAGSSGPGNSFPGDAASPHGGNTEQGGTTLSMGAAHCLDLPMSDGAEDETLPSATNPIFFAGRSVLVAQAGFTGIELCASANVLSSGSPSLQISQSGSDNANCARLGGLACHFVPLVAALLPQSVQVLTDSSDLALSGITTALARREAHMLQVRQAVLSAAATSWCLPHGLSTGNALSRPEQTRLVQALGSAPAEIIFTTDAYASQTDNDEMSLLSAAVARLGFTPVQLSDECSLDCSAQPEPEVIGGAFAGRAHPPQPNQDISSGRASDVFDGQHNLGSPQPGRNTAFAFPGRVDSPRRATLTGSLQPSAGNVGPQPAQQAQSGSVQNDGVHSLLAAVNSAARLSLAGVVATSSGDPLLVAAKRGRAMAGVTRDEVMPLAGLHRAAEAVGVAGILRSVLAAAPLPAWGTLHAVMSVAENMAAPPDAESIAKQVQVSTSPARQPNQASRYTSSSPFARLDRTKLSRFWVDWLGVDVREVVQNARITGGAASSFVPRVRHEIGATSDWTFSLGSAVAGCVPSLDDCGAKISLPQRLRHPANSNQGAQPNMSMACMTGEGWRGLAVAVGSIRASQLDRLDRRSDSVVEQDDHVRHSNKGVYVTGEGMQVQVSPAVGDIVEHMASGWHYAIAMRAFTAASGGGVDSGLRLMRSQATNTSSDSDDDSPVAPLHLLPLVTACMHAVDIQVLSEQQCWLDVGLRGSYVTAATETLALVCPTLSADVIGGVLKRDIVDSRTHAVAPLASFGTTLHGCSVLLSVSPDGGSYALPSVSSSIAGVRAHLPAHKLDVTMLTLASAEWIAVASHMAAAPPLPREISLPELHSSPAKQKAAEKRSSVPLVSELQLGSGTFGLPLSRLSCVVQDVQAGVSLTPELSCTYSLKWLQLSCDTQVAPATAAAGPGLMARHGPHSVLRCAVGRHSVLARRGGAYGDDTSHRIKLPGLEFQLVFDPSAVTGDVGTRIMLRFDSSNVALSPDILADLLDVQSSLQTEIVKAVGLFQTLRTSWVRQATRELEEASKRRRAARSSFVSSAGSVSTAAPYLGYGRPPASLTSGSSIASGDSFSTRGGSSVGMSVLTGGTGGGGIQIKVFQPSVNIAFVLPVGHPQIPQVAILKASAGLQVLQVNLPSIEALHQVNATYTASSLALQLAYHASGRGAASLAGSPRHGMAVQPMGSHGWSPGSDASDALEPSVQLAGAVCKQLAELANGTKSTSPQSPDSHVFSIGGIPLSMLPDDSPLVLAGAARAADGLGVASPAAYGAESYTAGLPVFRPRARSGSTTELGDSDIASPRGYGVQVTRPSRTASGSGGKGGRRAMSPQKSASVVQLLDNTAGHDAIVWRLATDVNLSYAPFDLTASGQGLGSPAPSLSCSETGATVGQLHSINLVFDAVSCLVLPSAARLTGECVAGLADRLAAYVKQAQALQESIAQVTQENATAQRHRPRRRSHRREGHSSSRHARKRAGRTATSTKPQTSVSSILPPGIMQGLTGMWDQTSGSAAKPVAALPAMAIAVSATRVAVVLPSVDTLGSGSNDGPGAGSAQPSVRHGAASVHSRGMRAGAASSLAPDSSELALFCTAIGIGSAQLRGTVSLVTPHHSPSDISGAMRGASAHENGVIELPLGVMTLVGKDFGVTVSGSAKDVAVVVRPGWGHASWSPQRMHECKYDMLLAPVVRDLAAAQRSAAEPEDPEGPVSDAQDRGTSGAALHNVIFMPLLGTSLSVALAGLPHPEHEQALVFVAGSASVEKPSLRMSASFFHDLVTTAACWQETSHQLDAIMTGAGQLGASGVNLPQFWGESPASAVQHTPRLAARQQSDHSVDSNAATPNGHASPGAVRWWSDPIVATSITLVVGGGSCELLASTQGTAPDAQVLQRLPLPAVTASIETCSNAGDSEDALLRAVAQRLQMVPRNNSAMLRLQCSPIEVSHSLFIFGQDCFATYKELRVRWALHTRWMALQRSSRESGADIARGRSDTPPSFGLTDTQDEPRNMAGVSTPGMYRSSPVPLGGRQSSTAETEPAASTWLSALPEGLVVYLSLDAQGPAQQGKSGVHGRPAQRLHCKVSCAPFMSGVWGVVAAEAPLSATLAVVKSGLGTPALSAHVHAPALSVQVLSDVSQPSQERRGGLYGRSPGHERGGPAPSTLLDVTLSGLSLPVTLSQVRTSRMLSATVRTSAVLHIAAVTTQINANRMQSMTEFRQAWAYSLLQAQAMLHAAMHENDDVTAHALRTTSGQFPFGRSSDPVSGTERAASESATTEQADTSLAQRALSALRGSFGDVRLLFALDAVHATARMETLSRYHPAVVLRAKGVLAALQVEPVLPSLISHRRTFLAALLTSASLSSRGRLWSTSAVHNATLFVVQEVDEDADLTAWMSEQVLGDAKGLLPDDTALMAELDRTLGITAGFGLERLAGSMYDMGGAVRDVSLALNTPLDEHTFQRMPSRNAACLFQVDVQAVSGWFEDDEDGKLQTLQALDVGVLEVLLTPEAIAVPSDIVAQMSAHVQTIHAVQSASVVQRLLAKSPAARATPKGGPQSSAQSRRGGTYAAQPPLPPPYGGVGYSSGLPRSATALGRGSSPGSAAPELHPALAPAPQAATGRVVLQVKSCTVILHGSAPVPGYTSEHIGFFVSDAMAGLQQTLPHGVNGDIRRQLVTGVQDLRVDWRAAAYVSPPPVTPLPDWSTQFRPSSAGLASIASGNSSSIARSDTILGIPKFNLNLHTVQTLAKGSSGHSAVHSMMGGFSGGSFFGGGGPIRQLGGPPEKQQWRVLQRAWDGTRTACSRIFQPGGVCVPFDIPRRADRQHQHRQVYGTGSNPHCPASQVRSCGQVPRPRPYPRPRCAAQSHGGAEHAAPAMGRGSRCRRGASSN